MSIKEGWEISLDRIKWYEKISRTDPLGDPIITSKCRLDSQNGFLIVGTNGFAWRIKITYWGGSIYSAGKQMGEMARCS